MSTMNVGNDNLTTDNDISLESQQYGLVIRPIYDGTITSVKAMLKHSNVTANKVKCALYNYSDYISDYIGSYIATTNEIPLSGTSTKLYTFTFSSPPTVIAGTKYYIVIWGEAQALAGVSLCYQEAYEQMDCVQKDGAAYVANWSDPITGEYSRPDKGYTYFEWYMYATLSYDNSNDIYFITDDNYIFHTNKCNIISLSLNDSMDTKTFNFWSSNDIEVVTTGLKTKNITIEGIETSDIYVSMASVIGIAEAGDVVTLSGMKNSDLDTTWLIESFSYKPLPIGGVQWSMTLEKYY